MLPWRLFLSKFLDIKEMVSKVSIQLFDMNVLEYNKKLKIKIFYQSQNLILMKLSTMMLKSFLVKDLIF